MKTVLMYFSPTHTTKRVARATARGIGPIQAEFDLTLPEGRRQFMADLPSFSKDEAVILAGPVYGGNIAPMLGKMLAPVKGNGAPAVLIGLYGNRSYDEALVQLYDEAVQAGFEPIAAAAFVGEHSFTEKIAAGRPNADDLAEAEAFGRAIAAKLAGQAEPLPREQVPFIARNMNMVGSHGAHLMEIAGPAVDSDACIGCGSCVKACPMANLTLGKDGKAACLGTGCIKCRACARACPVQAIDFTQEDFIWTQNNCVEKFGRPDKKNLTVL